MVSTKQKWVERIGGHTQNQNHVSTMTPELGCCLSGSFEQAILLQPSLLDKVVVRLPKNVLNLSGEKVKMFKKLAYSVKPEVLFLAYTACNIVVKE